MTTMAEDDNQITVSFVRQPSEHIAVMRQAGRRFAAGRSSNAHDAWGWYTLYAIGGGAGLAALFHVLRRYVFAPVLGIPLSITQSDMLIIWFVPTLIIYVLILFYSRWLTRRRLAAMESRIRPGMSVAVTITPEGASWSTAHTSMWFSWCEITNIGHHSGRIEFDLESFVAYIPAAAFATQGEQDAVFGRILGFWQAGQAIQP